MIRAETSALILLAAGRSLRFGERDKLAEPYLGRPLALHVVAALAPVPFARRIAVVSGTELEFADYQRVTNPHPEQGQAGSLRLGVAAAREAGSEAVIVTLADMPRVTAYHIQRLLNAAAGPEAIVASSDGVRSSPPALFGAALFDELEGLQGDQGARELIRRGAQIATAPDELVDIDTPEELERLRAEFTRPLP